MTNEDGSLWLVFNGEIYNFRELRQELEGRHRFRSQRRQRGDPPPLRGAGRRGGRGARRDVRVRALGRAAAAAAPRARPRRARSRSSTTTGPRLFAFASEVKALLAHPDVPHERDETALPLYLTYGYVPTPGTFYRGIRSLPPGPPRSWPRKAGVEGPTPYWRAAIPRRPRRATSARPRSASGRCCDERSSAGWSPTCRSAPSSRAASTPRRSSR